MRTRIRKRSISREAFGGENGYVLTLFVTILNNEENHFETDKHNINLNPVRLITFCLLFINKLNLSLN